MQFGSVTHKVPFEMLYFIPLMFFNTLTLPWDIVIFVLLLSSFGLFVVSWTHYRYHKKRYSFFQSTGILTIAVCAGSAFAILAYASFIAPQRITVSRFRVPL